MRPLVLFFLLAIGLLISATASAIAEPGAEGRVAERSDEGEHFYSVGRGVTGKAPLSALSDGSLVRATQVPCAGCHQKSGLGSSEGGLTVPPVTWSALTSTREPGLRSPYRSRSRRGESRPGYDLASLATVLRTGIDPSGRELDGAMPRYQLDDDTLAALVVHLKQLSPDAVPGVTAEEIHFATVIGPDVPEAEASAVIDVLKAMAKDKNSETRNESGRARRGVFYKDTVNQSFRRWVVHPWRLTGPAETWGEQLEKRLEQEPVFALISGITLDTYQPIDAFCQRERLPCILPNSQLPSPTPTDGYTLWLSRGFALEADLLLADLRKKAIASDTPISVLYDTSPARNEAAARVFAQRLTDAGFSRVERSSIAAPNGVAPEDRAPGVVVAVVNFERVASIGARAGALDSIVFFSGISIGSDLAPSLPKVEKGWVLHPFEDPKRIPRVALRGMTWLALKGMPRPQSRTHLDTYLAVTVTVDALRHMRTNFSRDYFMERIEHGLDNMVYRSVYPHLSLGPGQRIASKSGRLLSLDSDE